ncbi:TPA: FliC/FljB family flagellin [Escherichia coli]|uniref:FliC/FljB family flagellin n=1 Tax=Escherichia coli TaxID=562 RepID=UPI0030EE85EB|nr:FliC/FljB family flagellin [Escherichia coli]
MAQVINTNSLSLITQNNINKNQSALSSSIERLSSGLRINSAKDDAAGQAIANRFTSNIKGLTQAARNANDGISVAQTTEGALSEINNNLQRIRELTVQASTGTNSDSDLDSIQDEIKSRLDEIDRVSGQTQFNGVNVLAKDGSMKIQVGANDGQTITIDLKKIDSDTLGLSGFNVNGKGAVANTAATKDDLVAASVSAAVGNEYTVSAGLSKSTAADVIASLTDGATVTAAGVSNGFAAGAINVTGAVISADALLSASKATGFTSGAYTVGTDGVVKSGGNDVYNKADGTGLTTDNTTKYYLQDDGSVTNGSGKAVYVDATGKLTTDAETKAATTADPLKALDEAISSIDKFRSSLGAVQNRLDSAVTNLNNTTTNLSEAQSRIQDADYATEVSNMSKAQIIQQAGNSVLAKANQVPQQVLSLLQG